MEVDDHLVLKDDPDDENGASIQKIKGDLETQRMLWGFPAKNLPSYTRVPANNLLMGVEQLYMDKQDEELMVDLDGLP